MRKMQILISLIVCAALFNSLEAQDYKLAVGIRFSTPTATLSNSVSVKYFLNDRAAIEGLVSFGTHFGIGGLFEMQQIMGGVKGLNWFYGGGAYVGFANSLVYVGPTGIIGLDYKFEDAPIDLSLDWKPELDISPDINFIPDVFGFTVRFTLK